MGGPHFEETQEWGHERSPEVISSCTAALSLLHAVAHTGLVPALSPSTGVGGTGPTVPTHTRPLST